MLEDFSKMVEQVDEHGRGLISTFYLKGLEECKYCQCPSCTCVIKCVCNIDAVKKTNVADLYFRSCTKDIEIIQVLDVRDLNKHMTAFII